MHTKHFMNLVLLLESAKHCKLNRYVFCKKLLNSEHNKLVHTFKIGYIIFSIYLQGKTDMESNISRLEEEKAGLEKEVSDLKRSCEMIEKRAAEQKVADEKNHGEEINFLKRTNQQLKAQLEGIISQKK